MSISVSILKLCSCCCVAAARICLRSACPSLTCFKATARGTPAMLTRTCASTGAWAALFFCSGACVESSWEGTWIFLLCRCCCWLEAEGCAACCSSGSDLCGTAYSVVTVNAPCSQLEKRAPCFMLQAHQRHQSTHLPPVPQRPGARAWYTACAKDLVEQRFHNSPLA